MSEEDKKTQPNQFVIPYPPNDIFKYRQPISAPFRQVMQGGQKSSWIFDHVEYPEEGGIKLYTKKTLYPQWGWVFPEALFAVNIAKRFTRGMVQFIADKSMILPLLGFALCRKKTKIAILRQFMVFYVSSTMQAQANYVLEEKRYTPLCREIRKFIVNFLVAWGFKEEHQDNMRAYEGTQNSVQLADAFAESLITQIEYDNAYRWRIEDLARESNKELLLKGLGDELERLMKIYISREGGGRVKPEEIAGHSTINNFGKPVKLLKLAFYTPSFRRAFKEALEKSEFKNFQMDAADDYNSLLFDDYNYGGKPIEERIRIFREMHGIKFSFKTMEELTPEQLEEVKSKIPPRLFYETK